MKYTAQVRVEWQAKLSAIFVMRLSPRGSALSALLYFKLKDVLTEDTPMKFNTFIE